jgi:glutathione S-transferase
MKADYRLYSLLASMYSGKVRGYLNYKKLSYIDKSVNIFDLAVRIKSKTGERVVPVVRTRREEWLQDTTLIIEELEQRHPEPSIAVRTPVQYLLSLLLECWGDEYWLPVAMHYRWSYPDENREFFVKEVGRSLAPALPASVQRYLGNRVATRLDGAAPVIGFVPAQHAMLEVWTETILDLLETHFGQHDYLLGARPTIADFSLLASFFGHLNRDPAPKRLLMTGRPHLTSWVERTHRGDVAHGELFEGDQLPPTLVPIVDRIVGEFLPMVAAYQQALRAYIARHQPSPGDRLPRFVGEATFPMGNGQFTRQAMPYTLWMMQRLRDRIAALSEEERRTAYRWFDERFAARIAVLDLGPPLFRNGLSTILAGAST